MLRTRGNGVKQPTCASPNRIWLRRVRVPVAPLLKTRTLHDSDVMELVDAARLAAETYGFTVGAELKQFTLTENSTYLVSEPGRTPMVMRVYRPGGRPAVEVQSELAWMGRLRSDLGPIVPDILAGDDGAQLVEVMPSGVLPTCFCVAFSVAPGEEPHENELAVWFPRLGEITARLHQQSRAWQPPAWFARPRWDVSTTLGDHAHWGPWHTSVPDREERAQLQRLADVVTVRLQRFGTDPARFGLVHADLRLANLLVEGDDIQVIDFDDCGFSWYLYDLACALTFNEARADADELIAGWVESYRTVEPISAEDEAEIPTFPMLRRLMLSAYAGLRPDTELAHELAANRFALETCTLAETYLGRFDADGSTP
jgi:Ser/Thr protein kinase RdoA (MazF antagonist)